MDETYRHTLADIDSELHEADIKSLKFLCEPSLRPKKYLSSVNSGLEIFDALEKSNLLKPGHFSYLTELLKIIGRVDLAIKITPTTTSSYDFEEDSHVYRENRVCPFRTLLFQISEDLSSDELTSLRYLYGKVPKKDNIDEGIDLFSVMLKHQSVSEGDLSQLRKLLHDIQRKDLLDDVDKFSYQSFPAGKENYNDFTTVEEVIPVQESSSYSHQTSSSSENEAPMKELECVTMKEAEYAPNINEEPMDGCQSPISNCQNELLSFTETGSGENSCGNASSYRSLPDLPSVRVRVDDAVDSAAPLGTAVTDVPVMESRALFEDDDYAPVACYKMDAQPRGICIIIDNYRFTYDRGDREATELKAREGSAKDREALKATFEKLGFIVQIEENLPDTNLVSFVTNVSQRDHRPYDCFVSCILSHGGDNYIFGSNGRKVYIKDITSLFRAQACTSLAGKPKLFFMASCRGKVHQPGVALDIDIDAPEPEPDTSSWIPNEADFLFGYATVPNHVSYRSRTQGTFYISELTKVLDKYAHREDIHTLLVRVNDAVSSRVYQERDRVYKQVPAPQHTLRKQLMFF